MNGRIVRPTLRIELMIKDDQIRLGLAAHDVGSDVSILTFHADDLRDRSEIQPLDRTAAAIFVARRTEQEPVWTFWPFAFDSGFVAISCDAQGDLFLRSDLVKDISRLGGRTRGNITMSSLGSNGAFANQVFQYAYTFLYGLRLGCNISVPAWTGEAIYGIASERPSDPPPPELRYYAFDDDDLDLWRMDSPPTEADLWGYFQEIPAALLPHRSLLRRIYTLQEPLASLVSRFYSDLTGGGSRPLVAIHVRRGDYVKLHREGLPWYRPVPEAWYVLWLETVLAERPDAVVYAATDAPDDILPAFERFGCKSLRDISDGGAFPAVVDFEIMRRADRLAICNSSFSRMAAILADDGQKTVIPDFEGQFFIPFEAWSVEPFWSRFEGSGFEKASPTFGYGDEARYHRNLMIRREASRTIKMAGELTETWESWNRLNQQLEEVGEQKDLLNQQLEQVVEQKDRAHRSFVEARLEAQRVLDEARRQHSDHLRATEARFEQIIATLKQRTFDLEIALRAATFRSTSRIAHRAAFRSLYQGARVMRRLLGPQSNLAAAHLTPMISALQQYRHREAIGIGQAGLRSVFDRFARTKRMQAVSTPQTDLLIPPPMARSTPCPFAEPGAFAPKGASFSYEWLDPERDFGEQIEGSTAEIVILPTGGRNTEPMVDSVVLALLQAEPDIAALFVHAASNVLYVRRAALLDTLPDGFRPKRGLPQAQWIRELRDWLPSSYTYLAQGAEKQHSDSNPLQPWHPRWGIDPVLGAERLEEALRAMPELLHDGRPHCLVVVPWLPVGGSEVVLHDVLRRLAEEWRISIVTTIPAVHTMRDAFLSVTRDIYHAGDVFDADRVAGIIAGLATRNRSRAILTSNSGLLYERAAELIARLPGVSLVDIIHNDLPEGHMSSAVQYSAAFTTHIAISRKVGEALRRRGVPSNRIREIPNGVDLDVFAPSSERSDLRKEIGATQEDLVLGFIGRLSGEKRPNRFVDVVAELAKSLPVKAVMIGEGYEHEALQQRIDQENLPIAIRPKAERAALPSVYATLDFLVMTSSIEGMPLVALEALACGTPVASTRVGDIERIIIDGENGFLAPVEDVTVLADNIRAAFVSGRSSAMRAKARERIIASGMTREAMLEGYRALFRDLDGARQSWTVARIETNMV
jgi:glycosyltransferase involved in cell wall biosynthesis